MTERNWQNWNDDKIISVLEQDWSENLIQRKTLHKVLKELKEKHDLKTLHDVGGGTAASYPFLISCGYDYSMSDITEKMIEKAKEKFPEINAEVKDILDLTEEDKAEVVLNADVLIHVDDPRKYLHKLWEVVDRVLVLKLSYIWLKETRPDWDQKFYNWKFKYDDVFRMLANLNPRPKKIESIAVEDDEKTCPDFINEQVWVVWK